jgi:hypothetical protein
LWISLSLVVPHRLERLDLTSQIVNSALSLANSSGGLRDATDSVEQKRLVVSDFKWGEPYPLV